MSQLKYYIFLDDERNPWDVTWCDIRRDYHYNIVRSYNEFVGMIETLGYLPDFVTFDHDLADEHYAVMLKEVEAHQKYSAFVDDEHGGLTITFDYGREKTGFDAAKWLVDFCIDRGLKFPEYAVHSMNPIGRERIKNYIENAKTKAGI